MAKEINNEAVEPVAEKSPEKKEKKSGKRGFGKRIVNFFKEYKSELKKVVWCPKDQVVRNTGIVVVALAISGVLIGVLDLAFTEIILFLGQIG